MKKHIVFLLSFFLFSNSVDAQNFKGLPRNKRPITREVLLNLRIQNPVLYEALTRKAPVTNTLGSNVNRRELVPDLTARQSGALLAFLVVTLAVTRT